jgi:hypothetical protein
MDTECGLPSLKEKSWDLCLTDYPYNCDFKRDTINYKDHFEEDEYQQFCTQSFIQLQRVCNDLIIICGILNEWRFPKPNWVDCWFHKGSTTHTKMGGFSYWQPLLVYSDKIIREPDGISLSDCINHSKNIIHSSPKPIKLWKWEIAKFRPTSILDPFLGSGTTAQCCEEMGIPWLGFEIMEEYAPDIEKRIQLGIKGHESYKKLKKKQLTLGDIK